MHWIDAGKGQACRLPKYLPRFGSFHGAQPADELGTCLGSNLRISCSYDFHTLRLHTYTLIDRQTDRSTLQHSHTHPSGQCIVPRHCAHITHIYEVLLISTAFPLCSAALN